MVCSIFMAITLNLFFKGGDAMKKIFILAVLCSLIFLSFSDLYALEVNQDAPLFSLRDSDGEFFHLSDNITPPNLPLSKGRLGGVKGIILNFFSSTCVPCKRELPRLNSLADEFAKKNSNRRLSGRHGKNTGVS